MHETQYIQLILEFFSTYKYKELNDEDTSMTNNEAITFRLGGVTRNMSIEDFANALDIYPIEMTSSPHFKTFLDTSRTLATTSDTTEFWTRIGSGMFRPGDSQATKIKDSLFRMFHRLITKSINGRKEGIEKVTNTDIIYLYLLVNKVHVNLPKCVARYLTKAKGARKGSYITGGQIITRLARSLGLITPRSLRVLTPLSPMKEMDLPFWVSLGILDNNLGNAFITWGPRVEPEEPLPEDNEMLGDDDIPEDEEEEHDDDYTEAGESSSSFNLVSLRDEVRGMYTDLINRQNNILQHYDAHIDWMRYNATEAWRTMGYTPTPHPPAYQPPPPPPYDD